MTDDELNRIEASGKTDDGRVVDDDLLALVAEVRRLKGLIVAAEARGIPMGDETRNCPWCGYAHGNWKRKHSPECPAFTESGVVR